tara:strand:+ start:482 stop:1330 length:849 start_codon:yes stop_codon:yes gene_type:complete
MARDFSPKIDWKVSTERLESELVKLSVITGKDLSEILQQEGKLAAGIMMDNTPPFKTYGKKAGAKKVGDTRIKIEVGALFLAGSEFKGNYVNSPIDRIGEAVKARDTKALSVLLPRVGLNIPIDRIFPTSLNTVHQNNRQRDGRIKGKRKRGGTPPTGYFVRDKYLARTRVEINRQVKRSQKNVGKAKSGWLAGLLHFGGKAPGFVSRHGMSRGSFVDRTKDKKNPYLVIENKVKYMPELDIELNITRNAANKRKKAIQKRIEFELRAAARKTQSRANRKAA